MRDARAYQPREKWNWVVTFGFIAAFLLPALGLVLGIVAATRSKRPARNSGIVIAAISIVMWVISALVLRHVNAPH